jgi:DNA topoisomerase-2
MANAEISNVKQILGLQHGKEYSDVKSLRYGQLMIMTDQARARMLACLKMLACSLARMRPCLLACACMMTWHGCAQDHDGSHIKGLLINFLHAHFPSLLKARATPARAAACAPALLRCVALVALTRGCPGAFSRL